ncbi:hypothetical protein ACFQS7_14595 [Dankookia sp. GCM10030260]|uniref:hypothetical protein n=1 Tax=Dankookia sp. GCM10030260 TaxID=3273390 RepID=UPI0036181A80
MTAGRAARERGDIGLAILCRGATHGQWQAVPDIVEEGDTLPPIDAMRFDALRDRQALFERVPA